MRRVLIDLSVITGAQAAGTVPLVGGSGCITWHSTYETTGSASASYALFSGPTTAGQTLMYVLLSSAQSTRDYIGLHALPFLDGLFYKEESGSVLGSITAWVDHECEHELRKHEAIKDFEYAALQATLAQTQ